jgi:hypothetical protein
MRDIPGLTPPRPWHLLFAPLVPLLGFVNGNPENAGPGALPLLWIVLAGVVILLWLGLAGLTKRPRSSALSITVVTFVVLSYPTMAEVSSYLPIPHAVVLLYALAVASAVAGLLFLAEPIAERLTPAANLVALTVSVLVAISIARHELGPAPPVHPPESVTLPPQGTNSVRPDVYVIVFDAYGRADVLRDRFGLQNDVVEALRAMGFFVADRAASNYQRTGESIATALNFDYLQSFLGDIKTPNAAFRRQVSRLIADNRTFRAFHSAGYRVVAFESEYVIVRPGPVDDRVGPWGWMTDFEYSFYEATLVPRMLPFVGVPRGGLPLALHRRQIRSTFDGLEESVRSATGAPRFVFAHILLPHPPFSFNADGSARTTELPALFTDDALWFKSAQGTHESYDAGYVDAVRFLNTRLLAVIRAARSDRPSIFYIQGDHGPRSSPFSGSARDVRDRLGIMFAVRFPGGMYYPLHAGSTPVNGIRALLNRSLGTNLPALPDRSYFGNYSAHPFVLRDVSDSVH